MGRPPKCMHKLFHISEEDLEECRDEERGTGGAPAYDFYSQLRAFLIAPLYDCEANAESIWRQLARNPRFVRVCSFDPADVPSVRTLEAFQPDNERGGALGRDKQDNGSEQHGACA